MNKKEIKEHLKYLHNELIENISSKQLKDLIEKETYFAGGCFKSLVLNEKVNDYDLYFKNEEAVKQFKCLYPEKLNLPLKLITNNAITLEFQGKIIQFIIKFHGMPYQVINCFDFLHCQNFYNPIDGYIELKENIILEKELHFNMASHLPISSIKRISKFASQGWIIRDSEIIKLAKAINKYNLNDKKILREQIAGLNFSSIDDDPEVLHSESDLEATFDEKRVVKKVIKRLKGKEEDVTTNYQVI